MFIKCSVPVIIIVFENCFLLEFFFRLGVSWYLAVGRSLISSLFLHIAGFEYIIRIGIHCDSFFFFHLLLFTSPFQRLHRNNFNKESRIVYEFCSPCSKKNMAMKFNENLLLLPSLQIEIYFYIAFFIIFKQTKKKVRTEFVWKLLNESI